jgi:hypothetical protein
MERVKNESSDALLRMQDFIGRDNPGITPWISMGRSSWAYWVSVGKAPPPALRIANRTVMWRRSDIEKFIREGGWFPEKQGEKEQVTA